MPDDKDGGWRNDGAEECWAVNEVPMHGNEEPGWPKEEDTVHEDGEVNWLRGNGDDKVEETAESSELWKCEDIERACIVWPDEGTSWQDATGGGGITAEPGGGCGDNILALDDGTERWGGNAETVDNVDGRDEVNDELVAEVERVWWDDWKPEVPGWGIIPELVRFWPNKREGGCTCCNDGVIAYGGNDRDDVQRGCLDDTELDEEVSVVGETADWAITPDLVGVCPKKDGEGACCNDGVVTCGGQDEAEEGWLDSTNDNGDVFTVDEEDGWGIPLELVGVWPITDDGKGACCKDGVVTCGGNEQDEAEGGWLDGTDNDTELPVADVVVEVTFTALLESIIEMKSDDQ